MARPTRQMVDRSEQLRLIPNNEPLDGLPIEAMAELREVIAELLLDAICPKVMEGSDDE